MGCHGINVDSEVTVLKAAQSILVLVTLIAGMAGNPSPAAAERIGQVGIQGGYGSANLDWFFGARAELGTSRIFNNSRVAFDFNWFWAPPGDYPQGKFKYYEFDLNYLWPFMALTNDSNSNLYIGSGLNVGRGWYEGSEANWEFGLNALAGFSWDWEGQALLVEGGYKFITDFEHWFIAAGFLL